MKNFGIRLKKLRNDANITQDSLAEYLNISCQAVSKWENGQSLPDITLVPAIANFFGVSADELLGITTPEQTEELKQYENRYFELNRKGKVLAKIDLCREVLKKYPRNYQWMLNLAYGLVSYCATSEQNNYSKEHNFKEEAISICEKILADCTDEGHRQSAIQILCYNYPEIGKTEEAIKLANTMPDMLLCREALLSRIYKAEECLKQNQQNLVNMIDYSAGILYEMACRKDLKQGLSNDERIKFIKTAIQLYQIILDGDENSLFYNCRLSLYYLMIAKLYCYKNEYDKAIENLLFSEKCCKEYDGSADLGEQKYNSIFLNRLTWNPKNVGTNWDGTLSKQLLYNLDEECFDGLKDSVEFKALKKRLKR